MSQNKIEGKNIICCVGNNLATIIGAYEMAKAGRTVKLFTDGGSLGGFFSGVSIEGYDFDLGLILLEKVDIADTQNVNARSSMNSWLTAGERVSNWLDDQIDLYKVDTPEVYIFGKKYPDYIMSNRLDLLEKSGVELAEYLDFDSPYHASQLNTMLLTRQLFLNNVPIKNCSHPAIISTRSAFISFASPTPLFLLNSMFKSFLPSCHI